MKIFLRTFIILLTFTSCATKIKFDHYSLPCDTPDIEVGDLYLFENGKFFLQTRSCGKGYQNPANSYGTFIWRPDSTIALTSADSKLDLVDVKESKTADSTYKIYLLDKSSSGIFNETIKIILNQKDTVSWAAQFRIQFNSSKPTINSIQIKFPALNYITPIYTVKEKTNNVIEFKFNTDWGALWTVPTYLMLNNYTLIKQGTKLTGETTILTRQSPPTYLYVGSRQKNINKELKYFDLTKDVVNYLSGQKTTSP